jgi:murein DD-endopeptidase MepM/ murein hydrolase activator NlpD
MESTYRKRRYGRYNYHAKNKKNRSQEEFVENVIKQVIACCVIFLLIFGLKNINSPITNLIISHIKSALSYTLDFNSTYKSVATFTENLGIINRKSGEVKKNTNVTTGPDGPQQDIKIDSQNQDSNNLIKIDGTDSNGINNISDNKPEKLDNKLMLDFQEEPTVEVEKADVKIKQKMVPPLNGVITSKFGMRKHPLYQKDLFHYGIDIDGKKGENIVAAMDGEVVETGYNDTYGKYIKLKHQDDIYTFYAHCNEIMVKKGQQVKIKDVIAKVGDSGVVLGEHLHFEIWNKDKVLDPMKYIKLPLDPNMADG